jgi:hypothetical protein
VFGASGRFEQAGHAPPGALDAKTPSRGKTVRSAGTLRWLALGAVWVLAVGAGFAVLSRYSSEAGESGAVPASWPSASRISPQHDRATLVMFAHPQCPCTQASVSELARLMARFDGRLAGYVVFAKPADVAEDWENTSLRRRAAAIAGVSVVSDEGGIEAARFRAFTSGATVLYGPDGRLLFNGGITAARGHEGDSFGMRRISSLLTTGKADRSDAPVFGCVIQGHEAHVGL